MSFKESGPEFEVEFNRCAQQETKRRKLAATLGIDDAMHEHWFARQGYLTPNQVRSDIMELVDEMIRNAPKRKAVNGDF